MPDRTNDQSDSDEWGEALAKVVTTLLGDGVTLTDEDRTEALNAFHGKYGDMAEGLLRGCWNAVVCTDKDALGAVMAGMGECFVHAWKNGDIVEAFSFYIEMRWAFRCMAALEKFAGKES